MDKKEKHFLPIITLLIIAPFLGELLSGSSPPSEYFQPLTFILLTLLYGIGALLIRETARRWNKGWISILLMGMAYGIYEEGIMVRSFFDTNWMDLGQLAHYGRWIGINWIWAIALTIFHSVISISLPIMITDLLFPKHRDAIWLTKKEFNIFMILFLINAFLGPLLGMKITILGMIASIISIIGLLLIANTWTENGDMVKLPENARGWKISLAGILMMFGLIIGLWIFPSIQVPWVLDFMFLCILPWFGVWWLNRFGKRTWGEKEKWSLAVGLLLPWFILAISAELNNINRPDDTSGMILVAVIFVVFMINLRWIIGRRAKTNPQGDNIK